MLLRELTLENTYHWPSCIKLFIGGLAALIVFGTAYKFFVSPKFYKHEKLLIQEQLLKERFENIQQQVKSLPIYNGQLNTVKNHVKKLLVQIAQQKEIPDLLEDISEIGLASGLTIEQFAPAVETESTSYTEVPVHMILKGSYTQLTSFFNCILKMNHLVTWHDFEIRQVSEDKQQLTLTITAKIYRYKMP